MSELEGPDSLIECTTTDSLKGRNIIEIKKTIDIFSLKDILRNYLLKS